MFKFFVNPMISNPWLNMIIVYVETHCKPDDKVFWDSQIVCSKTRYKHKSPLNHHPNSMGLLAYFLGDDYILDTCVLTFYVWSCLLWKPTKLINHVDSLVDANEFVISGSQMVAKDTDLLTKVHESVPSGNIAMENHHPL